MIGLIHRLTSFKGGAYHPKTVHQPIGRDRLFVICLLLLFSAFATSQENNVALTEAEQAWLTDHPQIRVGIMDAWPPMTYVDERANPHGIGVDYVRALNRQLNGILTIVPGTFEQNLNGVMAKHLDALMDVTPKEEREPYFWFTKPYIAIPQVIVGLRDGSYLAGETDLHGKTVALERGFYTIERFRSDHPEITVQQYDSTLACLKAVSRGDVHAYVGNRSVALYLIDSAAINNLRLMGRTSVPPVDLAIGVRKDWPLLASILDKAMEGISEQERLDLSRRWPVGVDELTTSQSSDSVPLMALVPYVVGSLIVLLLLILLVVSRTKKTSSRPKPTIGRMLGIIAVALLVVLVVVSSWDGLRELERRTRDTVADSIRVMVESTRESLRSWIQGEVEHFEERTEDPRLLGLVGRLLALPRISEALLVSDALKGLRAFFDLYFSDYEGFQIISSDFISVASRWDQNVGSPNLISEGRPELLRRAFAGETVFVPPIYSDVPLPDAAGGLVAAAPTMFIATPLRADDGSVIAVATLRLDPTQDFTRLCRVGRVGYTGETYAFDETGLLLSGSRFADDLARLGLVDEGQSGTLSIRISDPGGDLSEGHNPLQSQSEWPLTRMAASATTGRWGADADGYRGYRGVRVLGAWVWDPQLNIGIATEIDEHEALNAHRIAVAVTVRIVGAIIVLALALVGFIIWNAARTAQRLKQARDDWERVAGERNAELRDQETKFRTFFDQTAQPMAILDTAGNIQDANQTATDLMGGSIDEIVNKPMADAPWWSDSPELQRDLLRTIQAAVSGQITTTEISHSGPGDLEQVFDFSVIPVRDDGGNIVFLLAMGYDLTGQRRMSRELRESALQFRSLFEGSLDAVFLIVGESLASCNRAAFEMLGHESKEELLALRTNDILPPLQPDGRPSAEVVQEHIALATEKANPFELVLRQKDGTALYTEVQLSPAQVRGKAGVQAVVRDISVRKRLAAEILEGQERLDLALEGANLGLWDWNPATNDLVTNDIWEAMLGYEPGTFANTTEKWTNLVHPDDLDSAYQEIDRHTTGATEFYRVEHRLKTSGGRWKWVLATGKALERNEKGEVTRFIGFHVDIDEIKQLQVELENARTAAEAATQAKSNFLANMSHEIRTPMNAIIGLSHLASKTDLNPKQRDYLEKIQSSALALLGIINDILDFTKIEAGKLSMEEIEFKLGDVLDNLASMLGMKASEKGLELVFIIDAMVPNELVGDQLRLGQILLNLVNNAIKFTETGEIVVSARLEKRNKTDAMVRFEVTDTGIGLTEEQQVDLFSAFAQADTSTTRKHGGSGLGLSISKRLSEMMGGEIGVESTYGEGSTFYFTARFGVQERRERKWSSAAPIPRNLRVLVVDDNATARKVLVSYLHDFSFAAVSVSSGEEALKQVGKDLSEGKKFDLMLVDYLMPGLNGSETVAQIRDAFPNSVQPKTILITAYGREEIIKEAHEAHVDGFLMKPVSQSTLYNAIMQVFGLETEDSGRPTTSDLPDEIEHIRGARVLLVEDNEINEQVAVELLGGEGFFVDVAVDGVQAIEMVRGETRYDIVLMDLQMPGIDGYAATREIRSDADLDDLPIVAMTADAMSGVREQVLDAGMNDYVTKPIEPALLWDALVTWIRPGRRRLPNSYSALHEKTRADGEISAPDLPNDHSSSDTIAGIDNQAALSRLGGNETLLAELLGKFVRDFATATSEITISLESGKYEDAKRIAHTAKGVAGSIAAGELVEAATELDSVLTKVVAGEATAETTTSSLREFSVALDALVEGLVEAGFGAQAAAGDGADETQKPAGTTEELRHLLTELKPHVQKRRPKPCRPCMEQLEGKSWDGRTAPLVTNLVALIRRYSFDEAQAIINELLEQNDG